MADYLASKPFSAELVVVDDGSTDGTFAAVKQIAVELPVLVVASHYEHNRGKGLAFKARKRVVYRGGILYFVAEPRHELLSCGLMTPIQNSSLER